MESIKLLKLELIAEIQASRINQFQEAVDSRNAKLMQILRIRRAKISEQIIKMLSEIK